MSNADKPARGGAAGILFLACVAGGGAALAFDLTLNGDYGFWLGAQPGARAVIGALAAVFVIFAGHLARALLARRVAETKGARDVGGHA